MLVVWISRVVTLLLMVVVVLPYLIVALTSNEVCQKIKNYDLQILSMGVSKEWPEQDPKLWILVEGGYLYSLSTEHLGITYGDKKAWLNIEEKVINANERFKVPQSNFTLKTKSNSKDVYVRYFFTGNHKGQGLLGRMTHYENNRLSFQTYKLNGVPVASNTITRMDLYSQIDFVANSWTDEGLTNAYGYRVATTLAGECHVYWVCTFKTLDESESIALKGLDEKYDKTVYLRYPRKVNIITGFFVTHWSGPYFIALDDNYRLTVAQDAGDSEYKNKFEVQLKDFIQCKYVLPERTDPLKPEDPTATPETISSDKMDGGTGSQMTTESDQDNDGIYFLIIFVLVLLIGAVAYWWWRRRTRKEKGNPTTRTNKKKKNKGKKKKDPNQSSGINSTIPSSSPSSPKPKSRAPKTVFKSMINALGLNKMKVFKAVDKANKVNKKKGKNYKPKVSKSSMIGSKNTNSTDSQVSSQASSHFSTILNVSKGSMIGSKDTEPVVSQASPPPSDFIIPMESQDSDGCNSKGHEAKARKPVDRKPKNIKSDFDEHESNTSALSSPLPNQSSSLMDSQDSADGQSEEPKDTEPKKRKPKDPDDSE